MNGKRPADPGPARPMKKGKKQVAAEFSDAVTEETLRKQVAEAWSCRTPFSHGNGGAVREARRQEEVWGGSQPPPTPGPTVARFIPNSAGFDKPGEENKYKLSTVWGSGDI